MCVERLIEVTNAQPLSSDGRVPSGVWSIVANGSCDAVVEAGSCATLIIGDGDATADINIDVEQNAQLNILHVVTHRSATQMAIALAGDAQCRVTEIVTSASDTRLEASLMARGSRFEHDGVFILTNKEQGSVTVDVNHISSDCSSRTRVKGVAAGGAHGSFSGVVYVAPDAQRTDSEQLSRNIVIGDSRIETLPQLEIYADDVKCSHGATVGQMDADAILYMRQRGLSLAMAKRLQIEGFVDDVVMHCPVEGVDEILMMVVNEKLTNL